MNILNNRQKNNFKLNNKLKKKMGGKCPRFSTYDFTHTLQTLNTIINKNI